MHFKTTDQCVDPKNRPKESFFFPLFSQVLKHYYLIIPFEYHLSVGLFKWHGCDQLVVELSMVASRWQTLALCEGVMFCAIWMMQSMVTSGLAWTKLNI